jgi:Ca2+-binding RTX toxin-like protein
LASLVFQHGQPTYDWTSLTADLQANGSISDGSNQTSVDLHHDNTHLVLTGTGLTVSGGLLVSGQVSSATLTSNGVTVFALTYDTAVSASTIQTALAGSSDPVTVFRNVITEPLTVTGSDDRDLIPGYNANGISETVHAGGGNDDIRAGSGNDTLFGEEGNDWALYSTGSDTYDGGNGYDVLNLWDANGSTVTMNTSGVAGGGTATNGSGLSTTFLNLERIQGSVGVDIFTAGLGFVPTNVDSIDNAPHFGWTGDAGDDVFTDNTNGQTYGTIIVDYDPEKLNHPGAGNNGRNWDDPAQRWGTQPGEHGVIINLSGASINNNSVDGPQTVASNQGYDTFGNHDTFSGIRSFRLTDANDYFLANNSGVNVFGHAGDDTLVGGSGRDELDGGDGNDTITGGGGDDGLQGGTGNDTINGGDGSDFLNGGAGSDTLTGGDASDFSADFFVGGRGSDTIVGGAHANEQNRVQYIEEIDPNNGGDPGTQGVRVNLSASTLPKSSDPIIPAQGLAPGHAIDSYGDTDTLTNIQNVDGTPFHDIIVGGDEDNDFTGYAGDDVLWGGGGWNSVGYGQEERYLRHHGVTPTHGVIVNLTGNSINGVTIAGLGPQTVADHTAVDVTGDHDYLLQINSVGGTSLQDYLLGGDEDNDFMGGSGNDYIDGGAGSNHINYQWQEDELRNADGVNPTHGVIMNLSSNALNNVSITGYGPTTVAAHQAVDVNGDTDTLLNIQGASGTSFQDLLVGGPENDYLEGRQGNDILIGGQGHDDLIGGDGNDTLNGGAGDDNLDGGAGVDTAQYAGNRSAYTLIRNGATLTVTAAGGTDTLTSVEKLQFADVTIPSGLNLASHDFNYDFTSDILFRNNSTGHIGIWSVVNGAPVSTDLGSSAPAAHVAAIGDFTGDGTADVLLRNDSNGNVSLWEMHNNVKTIHPLGGSGVSYHVVGVGDFNGDGTSDVLWRDDASGATGTWEMHSGLPTFRDLGTSAVAAHVAATGDFNGDGTTDILMRNDANGNVSLWEMHNNVKTVHLLGGSGLNYHPVGTGDFNGDGTDDIVWRDDASGATGIWEMHNDLPTWHDYGTTDVNHKIVATGDYNGDGTTDILWRDNSTGHTGYWEMHNFAATWHDLGASAADHVVVA